VECKEQNQPEVRSGMAIAILFDLRITAKNKNDYKNFWKIAGLFGYYLFKLLS